MGPDVSVTYTETVLDHYQNPRNVGDFPDATGVGEASHASDGDRLRLSIRVREQRVEQVAFQVLGCPAAIAAGSVTTELLTGRTLDHAATLTNAQVVAALGGLPEFKVRCSVLAEQALHAALRDHCSRTGDPLPAGVTGSPDPAA